MIIAVAGRADSCLAAVDRAAVVIQPHGVAAAVVAVMRGSTRCGVRGVVRILGIEVGSHRRAHEGKAQGATKDAMGGTHGSRTPRTSKRRSRSSQKRVGGASAADRRARAAVQRRRARIGTWPFLTIFCPAAAHRTRARARDADATLAAAGPAGSG